MAVKFEGVGYTYNEKSPVRKTALKNVQVEFYDHKINGVIGASGSGKTTLVQMINALLIPTKGRVLTEKLEISKRVKLKDVNRLRNQVGLVFQFPEEQFFNSNVRKELEFGMHNFHYKEKETEKRILEVLAMVGLDKSYLERDPYDLSSGEQRKVAIASVLVFNPKILVLDEPTIGLDTGSKENLIKLLRILKNRYQKTIILVTHDMDLLHQLADHIVVLHQGEIVLEGTKYEVFSNADALAQYQIKMPKIMEFSYKTFIKKGVKLGYRDDINDLIKDVYRHVK